MKWVNIHVLNAYSAIAAPPTEMKWVQFIMTFITYRILAAPPTETKWVYSITEMFTSWLLMTFLFFYIISEIVSSKNDWML